MTESIGGRIEIIGHAIATLNESLQAVDKALREDQSGIGREAHRNAVVGMMAKISKLADIQIELSIQFDTAKTE